MKTNNYIETKKQLHGLTPDEWDKRNIMRYIQMYDSIYPYPHPQSLKASMDEGIIETDKTSGVGTIRTRKNKDGFKKALHLPEPFVLGLKMAYPTIFSDKKQFHWFCRNFKELVLVDRT